MGGSSALFAVGGARIEKMFDRKFRAAIAYYPRCPGHSAIMSTLTLILIGEADDRNPAAACRKMVAQPHDDGASADLYVYQAPTMALTSGNYSPASPFSASGSKITSRPPRTHGKRCAPSSGKTWSNRLWICPAPIGQRS